MLTTHVIESLAKLVEDNGLQRDDIRNRAADTLSWCADRITTLESALAECRRDAERLDWLQTHAHTLYTAHDLETFVVTHFVAVHETSATRRGNVAPTVREAIDAAIARSETNDDA